MGLLGSVSKAEMNRMWGSTFKVLNKAYLAKRICMLRGFVYVHVWQSEMYFFHPFLHLFKIWLFVYLKSFWIFKNLVFS